MRYRLRLFGVPSLVDEHDGAVAFPGKALVLAACLAVSREGPCMSRVQAADLLWEDAGPHAAALNLRQLLARVRIRQQAIGAEFLRTDTARISLDTAALEIDVVRFQDLLSRSRGFDVVELCGLYGADFLAGQHLAGSELRQRVEVHRARLRQRFIAAVEAALTAVPGLGVHDGSIACQALLDIDPYNELACRTAVQQLREAGQPREAAAVLDGFCERLRTDLGIGASHETRDLAAGLARALAPVPAMPAALGDPGIQRPSAPPPRLTILPPSNRAGRGAGLAAALVLDTTINLCSLRSVAVLAPHTAWRIGQDRDNEEKLRECAVDYVVQAEFSALLGGPSLFVQLYRTRCRTVQWAERFPFEEGAPVTTYREVSTRIARSLAGAIERLELSRFDVEPEPRAYGLFLLGQRQLEGTDLPSLRRARKLFQAALASSPAFAPALSGLARCCHLEWLMLGRREPALLEQSLALSARAIVLDPADPRGHRERGVASLFAGLFDESIEALRRAEAAGPHFADVSCDLADALTHCGRHEQGMAAMDRAIALNPLAPDIYWWTAGGTNYLLGRYHEAMACLSRMADTAPADRLVAATWAMLGNRREAQTYVRRVLDEHPDFRVRDWLQMVPFRVEADRAHYETGLRAAGFQ